MKIKPEYTVDPDGLVHLMSRANPEFTLCGDAFDVATEERPVGEYDQDRDDIKPTAARSVTCPGCARVILSCRGVRIDPSVRAAVESQEPDR